MNGPAPRGTILIYIADCADPRQLLMTLLRVPTALRQDPRVHFLAILTTPAAGADDWAIRAQVRQLTVLRTPIAQGYGGHQKLAWRFAVDTGSDLAVLLRGDGSDPPEALPDLIAAWQVSGAEVVLGVRPARSLAERTLGRALGSVQRALTGRSLRDFQASPRAYATRLLRRVFFEVNDNGEAFDTDLLLQACHADARIAEVPLSAASAQAPDGNSDAASPRRPLGHLLDALSATAQLRMHRMGMLCSLKYQGGGPEVYEDKTGMRYSSHREALRLVASLRPRTLLDLGSGPGFIARACQDLGVRVTGLDMRAPLPGSMSDFVRHDLERELPVDPFAHDMVLLLDVIEHLARPEAFLIALRNQSRALRPGEPATRVVISTPNVAFAAIRLNLLFGRFNYAERGILDITHKRLFTGPSLLRALRDCGYRVERTLPIGVPFEAVVPGPAGRALGRLGGALARLWPTMFAFQMMVVCTPLPGLRQILTGSERLTAPKGEEPPEAA